MPIVEKAKAVYEAANTFRVNCLEKDGSPFFDDAKVWTTANLAIQDNHVVSPRSVSSRRRTGR